MSKKDKAVSAIVAKSPMKNITDFEFENGIDSEDFDYDSEGEDDFQNFEIPEVSKWSKLMREYRNRKSRALFDACIESEPHSTLIPQFNEEMPQPSPAEFRIIVKKVQKSFKNDMDTGWYGTYLNILQDYGGGAKALDPLDPFLQIIEYNVTAGWTRNDEPDEIIRQKENSAFYGYHIDMLYARLRSWADKAAVIMQDKEIGTYIGPPNDINYNFEVAKDPTYVYNQPNIPAGEFLKLEKDFTGESEKKHLEIFLHALLSSPLGPGIYILQKSVGTVSMIQWNIDDIYSNIEALEKLYCTVKEQRQSIPMTKNCSWFKHPIDKLLKSAIESFVGALAANSTFIVSSLMTASVQFLKSALIVDKRIAMAMKGSDVAAILSGVLTRLQDATVGCYPKCSDVLIDSEELWNFTIDMIEAIFNQLNPNKTKGYLQYRLEDTIDSPEALHAASVGICIRPILIKAVADKINPIVRHIALSALKRIFTLLTLPDDLPLSLLKKDSWAALTSIFTNPYVDNAIDAPKLHFATRISVSDSTRKNHSIGHSASEWNDICINACCDLLVQLAHRSMIKSVTFGQPDVVKLGIVGKQYLKRGIVQLLLEQGTLHPDNKSIIRGLAEVLNCMTRSRDGRVIMLRSDEAVGMDLKGIELLKYFFHHSDWEVVSFAFIITVHLLWDEDWKPLIFAMDPPIECLIAKWASFAVYYLIREGDRKRENLRITEQIESICRKRDPSPALIAKFSKQDFWLKHDSTQHIMGSGACYPVHECDSQALLLMARCIMVLNQLLPTASNENLVPRIKRVKLFEFLAACAEFPSHSQVWSASAAALSNFSSMFAISPEDIPDPQHFLDVIVDDSMGYGNYYSCGRSTCEQLGTQIPLLNRIIGNLCLERKRKNSVWEKYFADYEKRLLKRGKTFRDHYFKITDRIMETTMNGEDDSVFETPRRLKPNRAPELHDLLQLKTCSGASCMKIEVKLGEFKACSRCRKVNYCSKECQASDWKKHKSGCIAK